MTQEKIQEGKIKKIMKTPQEFQENISSNWFMPFHKNRFSRLYMYQTILIKEAFLGK